MIAQIDKPHKLPDQDGAEEPKRLHLEYARGYFEELYGHRRRHHRRYHDRQKLLLLEAIPQLLITLPVDPLQQEQLRRRRPR